jgi:hypothetical protein
LLVGIEKSGTFVTHFEEVDKREDGGQHFEGTTGSVLKSLNLHR